MTWSNAPGGYPGLSPVTAYMPSGNFACFDITSIVEWWKTYGTAGCGFTMKNPNETSDLYKKVPCSSETAITDRRPYAVMIYAPVNVSVQTTYLLVGGTKQVTCTTNPTGLTVSWSSSNTSIATVNNSGLVTGISEGTVRIIATYTDTATESAGFDYVDLTIVDWPGIKDDIEYYIMNYSSKRYLALETASDVNMTYTPAKEIHQFFLDGKRKSNWMAPIN